MKNRTTSRSLGILLAFIVLAPLAGATWAENDRQRLPAFQQRRAEREGMVRTQMSGHARTTITDRAVLDALRTVPRHRFIPVSKQAWAYSDTPVPIGYGQTISQPYIVALMTQALELTAGMKVLEVGTGSGYQAAVLAEITPEVYTIEIIEDLSLRARIALTELGYRTVTAKAGDGYYGLKDAGPFDRIIVTCAALHVPPPLFQQLKPGGKMVIPVGGRFEVQRLLLVTKEPDERRSSRTLEYVRFVPLVRGTAPR